MRRPSIAPDWTPHQIFEFDYELLSGTFQNCSSPENKYIALTNTRLLLNCLCFMATFIVHNLFAVRNLNNGNLGEKSVYVCLAVLSGFPCPLKGALQCSADKKVWEPLSLGIRQTIRLCCRMESRQTSMTCHMWLTHGLVAFALMLELTSNLLLPFSGSRFAVRGARRVAIGHSL